MKHFLLFSFLFISFIGYAQHYDILQYSKNENGQFIIQYDKEMPVMYKDMVNNIVPYYIINDYNLGDKWYKSGAGIHNNDIKAIKAGSSFFGIGGAMIGIGIPLICFGDNMKRNSNRDFKIYIDLLN